MSEGWFVIVIASAWLMIGLALSLVMGRRGHDAWSWLVLGTLLGPFGVALAVDARRHRGEQGTGRVLSRAGLESSGPVDILVGVDGSAECQAAAIGVLGLFGARLGRITLVTVIPYGAPHEHERIALGDLERQARHFEEGVVGTQLVRGRPADALRELAQDGGYDVLAVGSRGTGRARLLGSVASQLARGSKVPVLMFSTP